MGNDTGKACQFWYVTYFMKYEQTHAYSSRSMFWHFWCYCLLPVVCGGRFCHKKWILCPFDAHSMKITNFWKSKFILLHVRYTRIGCVVTEGFLTHATSKMGVGTLFYYLHVIYCWHSQWYFLIYRFIIFCTETVPV